MSMWLLRPSVRLACVVALIAGAGGVPHPAPTLAVGTQHESGSNEALPSCTGAGDLLIDGGRLSLQDAQTFDRVCIEHGGTLLASHLHLRVGELYVDATGSIRADGEPGAMTGNVDCGLPVTGSPKGGPGDTLTIEARRATVLGTISAQGGRRVPQSLAQNRHEGRGCEAMGIDSSGPASRVGVPA
jgi:hypothetical protein